MYVGGRRGQGVAGVQVETGSAGDAAGADGAGSGDVLTSVQACRCRASDGTVSSDAAAVSTQGNSVGITSAANGSGHTEVFPSTQGDVSCSVDCIREGGVVASCREHIAAGRVERSRDCHVTIGIQGDVCGLNIAKQFEQVASVQVGGASAGERLPGCQANVASRVTSDGCCAYSRIECHRTGRFDSLTKAKVTRDGYCAADRDGIASIGVVVHTSCGADRINRSGRCFQGDVGRCNQAAGLVQTLASSQRDDRSGRSHCIQYGQILTGGGCDTATSKCGASD